jgi:hypothetical protein
MGNEKGIKLFCIPQEFLKKPQEWCNEEARSFGLRACNSPSTGRPHDRGYSVKRSASRKGANLLDISARRPGGALDGGGVASGYWKA